MRRCRNGVKAPLPNCIVCNASGEVASITEVNGVTVDLDESVVSFAEDLRGQVCNGLGVCRKALKVRHALRGGRPGGAVCSRQGGGGEVVLPAVAAGEAVIAGTCWVSSAARSPP